jgi:hypothetical protein
MRRNAVRQAHAALQAKQTKKGEEKMPKMIETFRDKVNLISAPLSDLLRDGYAKLTKRGHGRVYAKITFEDMAPEYWEGGEVG